MTPFELMAIFTRRKDVDDSGEIDRLGELHRHNHVTRAKKGLPPVVPPWFLPGIPRR